MTLVATPKASDLNPEERLQVYVVRRLEDILPAGVEFRAIEQGIKFRGDPVQRMRAWQRLVNKGVKPGTTDLHIWWNGRYATIELMVGRNTVTDHEARFMASIQRNGFYAGAAWSAAEVEAHILAAGIPLSGTMGDIDARLALEQPAKPPRKPRTQPATKKALRVAAFAHRPPG